MALFGPCGLFETVSREIGIRCTSEPVQNSRALPLVLQMVAMYMYSNSNGRERDGRVGKDISSTQSDNGWRACWYPSVAGAILRISSLAGWGRRRSTLCPQRSLPWLFYSWHKLVLTESKGSDRWVPAWMKSSPPHWPSVVFRLSEGLLHFSASGGLARSIRPA